MSLLIVISTPLAAILLLPALRGADRGSMEDEADAESVSPYEEASRKRSSAS